MGTQTAFLRDVCSFQNGGTPSKSIQRYFQGNIPWITGADIDSPVVTRARSFITEDAIENSATNRVPLGTVLLVTRTSVGKVAVAGVDLCFSQDITALTPNPSQLFAPYLVHFLRTRETFLERQARGATIRGVTREVLSNLQIPLPSVQEQRRIAAILDKAEELRAKCRTALVKLETLTQSIFIDLFGDPIINSKKWSRIALGDLLRKIDSGRSPICLDRPAQNGEWGVLKLGAVTWCEYNPAENKALPPEVMPEPELEVKPGDLLFTRKNTYELVAACALVRSTRPKLLLSDLIFRLHLKSDSQIDACYLHQLMICPSKRREIQRLASGSAGSMPNISKERLQTALVEIPPISLQRNFSGRIAVVERLKLTYRNSLASLDQLFSSLQHRAFRGEL